MIGRTMANPEADEAVRNQPVTPDPPPDYPYPGLRPFKTEEAAIFYGRNSQKDAILERLNHSHMVFILGSSGCGKSSLVKAGVIPALKAGLLTRQGYEWRVIDMRPGRTPLNALAEAFSRRRELDKAQAKPTKDDSKPGATDVSGPAEFMSCWENEESGLWSASSILLESCPKGTAGSALRYLLLVDQFEEIFAPEIERAVDVNRFVKLMTAQYARPHPALFVVFTMRTDYFGNCSSFPGLSEAVNDCSYLIPILTEGELREAIVRPASDYGASVEPRLVELTLTEMRAGANYEPDNLPLLQHALLWLWQKAIGDKGGGEPAETVQLTADDYEAFGRMKGILNKHADDTLRIAAGERDERLPIVEALFRRLSERDAQGRFRRCPATFAEIKTITACGDVELECVVEPFADKRASFIDVRPAETSDERLLDVSHEALIRCWDRANRWAVQERQKIEAFFDYLRGATAWRDGSEDSRSLKGQPDLGEFDRWWRSATPSGGWFRRYYVNESDEAKRKYPSADEAVACVDRYRLASLRADGYRKLRMRLLEALALGLAIFVPAYVIYSLHLNAVRARAQAIADRAEYVLGYEGPAKALLIATEAQKLGLPNMAKTERVLVAALRKLREKRVISDLSNPVSGIAYSPDGSAIANLVHQSVQFRDAQTGKLIDTVSLPAAGKFGLTWSYHGDWIGVNLETTALLLRPCSHERIRSLFPDCRLGGKDQLATLGNSVNLGGLPRFSEDGKWAVTAPRTGPPVLWEVDAGTGKRLAEKPTPMPFGAAISPDMKRIALGFANSEIQLVDAISGKTVQTLKAPIEKSGDVLAVEFNPKDPNMLAASLLSGDVLVWNIKEGSYTTLKGGRGNAYSLAFSRDGRHLAASSDDRSIRTWPTDNFNASPAELRGHTGPVYLIAYSPVSNTLASGSADRTIRIWDEHSAFRRDERDGPKPDTGTKAAEPPSWMSSINPPREFGEVAGYAKEGDHAVIAGRDGKLALFILGADHNAIAIWRSPNPIAALEISRDSEKERDSEWIVAISPSGKRESWPFLPTIKALVHFADDHIPFDGDHRLNLSSDELCVISPPDDGCPSDQTLSE
jgi:WD40 repeat protein